MRPIVVVKDTSVPFCTGVPAPADVVLVVPVVGVPGVPVPGVAGVLCAVPFSMTFATISTSPLSGTVLAAAKRLMTEPLGATSGTLSHATASDRVSRRPSAARPAEERFMCVTIGDAKDNSLMCLEGGQDGERGYAMAALLVSLAVMLVLMTVAMPVWRTQTQREKEAELIFRGEQIARSINLYMRKMGGGSYPPNLDVLVQGRFLRQKYKDPMTENDPSMPMNQRGEWDVITAAGGVPGGGEGGPSPQQGGRGRIGAPSTGLSAPPSRGGPPSGTVGSILGSGGQTAG